MTESLVPSPATPEPVRPPPVEVRRSLSIAPGGELRRTGMVTRASLVATLIADDVYGNGNIDSVFAEYAIEFEHVSMIPTGTSEERVVRTLRYKVTREDAAILASMR